ncbi:PAS domain-containing protein [Rhodovibrionaceae bacterium A322]
MEAQSHFVWEQDQKVVKHTLLQDLLQYWTSLCPTAGLPSRKQLDPLDMPKGILKNFFIYDVHYLANNRLDYLVSLAGGELCSLFGREMKGLSFDEVHPSDIAEVVKREFDMVVQKGQPHYAQRWGNWSDDGPLPYERLLLPFADDGQTVSALAGASFFDSDFPLRHRYMQYTTEPLEPDTD